MWMWVVGEDMSVDVIIVSSAYRKMKIHRYGYFAR
jgi:hypothetical protein